MQPTITEIILKLEDIHGMLGITLFDKASPADIDLFEQTMGIKLPQDLKTFYLFCNGFEQNEDMFRMIPLDEIIDNTLGEERSTYFSVQNGFHVAEYCIYCDTWELNLDKEDENKYTISHLSDNNTLTLTDSLPEFLNRFLNGGLFNGLYPWQSEIEQRTSGQ
ncbi:SMI1/KNR4 family protein [Chitinophaga sp. ARDCPP14]|uniref:SMI1/KNR4 family protein n=1 Tax=Chitinophaga sp. ARDCPP14 TaxID=3391139 RepID=UPI003F51EA9B